MIKTKEVNASGLVIIYVEISFRDSERMLHTKRLKTGDKTIPNAWKGEQVMAKHGEGYKALNRRIQRKKGEVLEYISVNPKASLQQIKKHFDGKEQVQHLTFFNHFEQFIKFKETIVKVNSLKPTRTTLKELKTLLPNGADVSTCINYDLFQMYYTYLHGKGLKPNTIITRLKKLRGFCNYLSDKKIIEDTTYQKFKIGDYKDGKMVSLTVEEMESLFVFDLSKNKRLEKVRDLLLFTCNTALRHSDSAKVRPHHIVRDNIQLYLNKGDVLHSIPLNNVSRAILKKYGNNLSELKISNEKYNLYLKELGELVGINSKVTVPGFNNGLRVYKDVRKYLLISSHIGRKTFCTISLELGMPEEVIMKISGHKDRRSFRKYLNLTDTLKEKAMSVWDVGLNSMKVAEK